MPNQSDCQAGSCYFDTDGKQWLFWWQLVRPTQRLQSFLYRPTITLKNRYGMCDIISQFPSCVTLAFMWSCTDAENMQRDQVSHGRGKTAPLPIPLCSHHLCFMFFVTRWWLPMMSEWRRVQCGHWRWGALACSPSLNSLRSNLQTAAEFWQILPRCLLPLGDTFFIYFSSPLLWYSLHGALAPQAIVSSVLLPCLKNQMDLQGLLSTPPLFWAYSLLFPLFYFHTLHPFMMAWPFLSSWEPVVVALA